MISVMILEADDVLKASDWCRPLALCTMSGGQSDDYSFKCMYSGNPENNVKWVDAGSIFRAFIGKKINTLPMEELLGYYEFVRGAIPLTHIHPHSVHLKESDCVEVR